MVTPADQEYEEMLQWRDVAMLSGDDDFLFFVLMRLDDLEKTRGERNAAVLFQNELDMRAPNLSMGTGRWRDKRLFGAASNYARNPNVNPHVLTGGEYYSKFRFCREHIPRLVAALGLPQDMVLEKCRGRLAGEEAFLIFLAVMAYPKRYSDLTQFFGRSTGYLSEVVNDVAKFIVKHHGRLIVGRYSHLRRKFQPFADAIQKKGAPFDNLVGFLDGTFKATCRPGALPGQDGHDRFQRSVYSGHKHEHGLNYQGVLTPDSILREARGPMQGSQNDQVHVYISRGKSR